MSKELALPEQYSLKPIGIVHSCFKEKFAIPRQPALVPAAKGEIELFSPYDDPVALEGLEEVSHLWLSFIFHQALPKENEVRLRVRPPRLGGNKKIGTIVILIKFSDIQPWIRIFNIKSFVKLNPSISPNLFLISFLGNSEALNVSFFI